MLQVKDDAVNPKHYSDLGQYSAVIIIRVWSAWRGKLGLEPISFNTGNAIKYIQRAGTKPNEPEIRDLKKAIWYLNSRVYELDPENEKDPAA